MPVSIDVVLDLLRCPHCGRPFERLDATVRCESGHAFDVARQGYLNLLGRASPVNADSAAMVAARERFLGTGAYAAVADALVDLTTSSVDPVGAVLDVGAGSGYYLARTLARAGGRGLALDISAYAARRAARAHDRIGAVVADAWAELPVGDDAVDVVLSVFAPRQPDEFARVLRPGGAVVIVTPRPEHLAELRSTLGLLAIETGKADRISASMTGADFTLAGEASCAYRSVLPAAAVVDLVAMGPNAFHHDQQRLVDQVTALGAEIEVGVATSVTAWRRTAPA